MYNVARSTSYRAVKELHARNLIYGQQGQGVFVAEPEQLPTPPHDATCRIGPAGSDPSVRRRRRWPVPEEWTVKYMLLIWNRPGFADELTEAERTAIFGEVDVIMKALTESGELVGGEALADPSQTRTVRPAGGGAEITDGPFVESKEQFAGYLTVDCETPERAVEIAASWPDVRLGFGVLEVRAVMEQAGTEM
ncbi:hypothetical protein C8054_01425 [Micromonospora sp. RP3T]|nr:hypothetical protein C8054_01425 [Micromonospora sp. RP3T]